MREKVFIIAELSANHNGDIEVAKETIRAAKLCGADAIKLQTYTADTLTLNCKNDYFKIEGGTAWDGQYLHDLYDQAHTPWEWHPTLFEFAKAQGLVCFSSPFDATAVDFLEELECPIYKIASFEIQDIPLLKYVAAKNKPIIISTGIATIEDIELAIKTCKAEGNDDITILKCTSQYPAKPENANLLSIQDLKNRFGCKIGLSDHTLGIEAPIVSVALGATVIEKHFILDKSIGGADAHFSLDQKEFKQLVDGVRKAELMLGEEDFTKGLRIKSSQKFSRSLFVAEDIKKDEVFTAENVRSVRPGYGMHPKFLEQIIGMKANNDVLKGTPLAPDLIKDWEQ